jgi:ABC-type Mn2+/Zn2+ transport system permease subunit
LAVVLGWSTGFVACLLGLGSSYKWNWPYGPTLVLFLGLFFVAALVVKAVLPASKRLDQERSEL